MEGVLNVILVTLFATNVLSVPEERLKRNYNNEHAGSTGSGYAIGSDERDASIEDSGPCSLLDNSDSREHGYGLDGHLENDHHRGVSVKAAAAASASSYS